MKLKWCNVLKHEKEKPYFLNILKTIEKEKASGITVYPPKEYIFNAFKFTEFNNIKVVIIGQDPYHGEGQANGLAFSVFPGIAIPPSLHNIYKELKRSIPNFKIPSHGYLETWAKQGVLLLNTTLTVRAKQANSHNEIGWEIFTNKVISLINSYCKNIVFLLWGLHAQKKANLINNKNHQILTASHPSPRSTNKNFLGCNHFVLVNRWLKKQKKDPINWLIN